jgi:hypothetical protein
MRVIQTASSLSARPVWTRLSISTLRPAQAATWAYGTPESSRQLMPEYRKSSVLSRNVPGTVRA